MLIKSVLILLLLPCVVYSATFENVTVLLTTHLSKLFFYGRPPLSSVFIKSSDSLSQYVNFQPLEILRIQNETIPKLRKGSVSNLYNIATISIVSSGVEKIEPGAFRNLPKLDELNLGGNSIEEIGSGVFTGLRIKSLFLHDNKISKIENEAFNNMTLTLISLNNNRISKWKSDWFVGSPVGSIFMTNNLLEEIPADAFDYGLRFKRLNVPLTLWHLDLSQNWLGKVHPKSFNHVNAFGYLSLADNYLRNLPKDVFRSVKNINTLDLRKNRLDNVEEVFDDINIDQLILINNTLSCFPVDVFDISRINYIFLDGNPFTCGCVEVWNDFQVRNNLWVVYNMQHLEDGCVEK